MTSDHIQDIFKDYLKAENTQYAIMINGKWGGGKTYFWKEKLKPLITGKQKPIYITLNGISKIETVEYHLLLGLIPLSSIDNKIIKSATKFIGNATNVVTKYFTKSSSASEIFNGVVVENLNYSNKIICIDDLERCQIPIEEILGFINNFIEHKSMKVLFLADETKIDSVKYREAKEKIIRHTVNFEPYLEELIPQLAKKFTKTDPDYYNYLITELSTFTEIFTEYKENNLRNISFVLDCLQPLFPEFKKTKKEFQIETILFTIIISLELKKGNIQSTDYSNSKNLNTINFSYYQILKAGRKDDGSDEERDKSYAEIICDRYLSKRIEQYYYFGSIYKFVLSGYLDLSEYKKELAHRNTLVTSQEVLDLRTVANYNFRTLPQKDFERLSKVVWKNAIAGKYSIYDYVLLADFYYFFSDKKLIKETIDEVKSGLIKGLNIAKKGNNTDNYQMSNLLAFKSTERIQEFKKIVSQAHEEMKGGQHKELANRLVSALSTNDLPALKELMPIPGLDIHLYNVVDKENLLTAVLETSNATLQNFIDLFSERYRFSNVRDFLHDEKPCIDYLKTGLENYLATSESGEGLKKLMLRELKSELDEISKKLG
ncbi:P-loop NTPase fold protein [Sphingobacterium spiritivorum]|uniref:P-loop NTPase fold protein n=1 Tax=Sphingobacterium spiritivorum TaxID=258 RepID=UPI003DA41258